MLITLLEMSTDYDMGTLIDLPMVLKRLGKLLVMINLPDDVNIQKKLSVLLTKALQNNFDEEIKAMLPYTFEGLCYLYYPNLPVLVDLYHKFDEFLKREIEAGRPQEKKKEATPLQPPCVYYDLLQKEKSKSTRENYDDLNYLVNKSIAQNMHFFFGAFVKALEEKDILADEDAINMCLLSILQSFSALLKSKDRELLHHVLFSFKCYHDALIKASAWEAVSDQVREAYLSIIRTEIH